MLRGACEDRPGVCSLVRGTNLSVIPYLSGRDVVVAEGILVICFAYFPFDSAESPPPAEVRKVVEYCNQKGLPLLLRCDANAHNRVWGITDSNLKGHKLLECLNTTDLNLLNRVNEPTFRNAIRGEVIDLTLLL